MAATLISGKTDPKLIDYDSADHTVKELVDAAVQARKNSYSPYSNFAVGAALRTTTGRIFTGCNIENAAYSPSLCAERVAIGKAVSEGFREYTALAVVAYQENDYTAPCGVCRQTLSEFSRKIDLPIYLAKPAPGRIYLTSLFELLPNRFNLKD